MHAHLRVVCSCSRVFVADNKKRQQGKHVLVNWGEVAAWAHKFCMVSI